VPATSEVAIDVGYGTCWCGEHETSTVFEEGVHVPHETSIVVHVLDHLGADEQINILTQTGDLGIVDGECFEVKLEELDATAVTPAGIGGTVEADAPRRRISALEICDDLTATTPQIENGYMTD
jgi:hypothetical protein